MSRLFYLVICAMLAICIFLNASSLYCGLPRWSIEEVNEWYQEQPWIVGCNFIPSTAVNQLEMWQEDTFDPVTIDRELSWASSLGFSTVRVYLHDMAWRADAVGFKERINKYLDITEKYGIRTTFVIFDDVGSLNPEIGKQPDPMPGMHNSQWLKSPALNILDNPDEYAILEAYVKDILSTYADDSRILMWDLYNEPAICAQEKHSLSLLNKVFEWAREVNISQPVTSGIWHTGLEELIGFQLEASDVITFHCYNDLESLKNLIKDLKEYERPLICTEYMARTLGSRFETHLPIFKDEKIGCYNWGLVAGKTQTIFPWYSEKGSSEPELWFHDILKKDGAPFDSRETELIKLLIKGKDLKEGSYHGKE